MEERGGPPLSPQQTTKIMDKELFTKIYLSVLPAILHAEYQSYFADHEQNSFDVEEVITRAGALTKFAYDDLERILKGPRQLGKMT
jgi:hypothetical protein